MHLKTVESIYSEPFTHISLSSERYYRSVLNLDMYNIWYLNGKLCSYESFSFLITILIMLTAHVPPFMVGKAIGPYTFCV